MFLAPNIRQCAKYKLSRILERIWMNKSFSAYLYTIDTGASAGSAVSVTVRSGVLFVFYQSQVPVAKSR